MHGFFLQAAIDERAFLFRVTADFHSPSPVIGIVEG